MPSLLKIKKDAVVDVMWRARADTHAQCNVYQHGEPCNLCGGPCPVAAAIKALDDIRVKISEIELE
jgi:hypothetical protein